MADNELVALQTAPSQPRSAAVQPRTDMALPPMRSVDRLRHLPEEVYDLRPESTLVKFAKVLLGDAGAGQLRKRLLIQRMQNTIRGTHFYDLDRFYGPLFGLRRSPDETLSLDPYSDNAITEVWDEVTGKDSSFRSRIEQFAKALAYGPTPTGMELIAEALLSVDVDVYESWIQADESYQTHGELEDQYGEGTPGGFYSDMEGVSYGELEGQGLARMSGDERRVFTIRPKRRITLAEAHDLRRVLNRIKPADSRFTIDAAGIDLHEPVPIDGAVADSNHWEVTSTVASKGDLALAPYQINSGIPTEQPKPPWSNYQGEAWSYNSDISGVAAGYLEPGGQPQRLPIQRITLANDTTVDFSPEQAPLPRRAVQSGRSVSDGVLVIHPYGGLRSVPPLYQTSLSVRHGSTDIAKLYSDGVPLEALNDFIAAAPEVDPFRQNPVNRCWVSGERPMSDPTEEHIEIRLTTDRLVNYISFEYSQYPHAMVGELYDTEAAEWIEVYRHNYFESRPATIPLHDAERTQGHPLHSALNHWARVGIKVPAINASRFRLRMSRITGKPPLLPARQAAIGGDAVQAEVAYSLAIRGIDLGYRVQSRADFEFLSEVDGKRVLGTTRDMAGSLVEFTVSDHRADRMVADQGFWRCGPQPINYGVVNLYLDTRGPGNGDGRVIDRFFMDPTHTGAHLTLYYSNDPQDTDGTTAFYEDRSWTPIPRDYTVQKGYLHLPATRARYWKFEFTNLSVEPYESLLAVNRTVRLFPQSVANRTLQEHFGHADAELPTEMLPTFEAVRETRYRDAPTILGVPEDEDAGGTRAYLPTESLYVPDLSAQVTLRDESWAFGFTPWHQGDYAPRFSAKGRHVYEEVEVPHKTKVAFFVGLRELKAYRTQWEADDDTQVYFDTFDDFRNLEPGFTWAFEPGFLTTVGAGALPLEATSRTFSSRNNIEAIQFATEQSQPVQLVPDHDFRDPFFGTYEWNDPDFFLRVGDAQLIYSPQDHSVLHLRHVVPPTKPLDRTGGLVQGIHQPVFSYRPYEVVDEAAANATEGGIATPLLGLSAEGRVYAAVRFTADTTLSSPLYLQVVDANDGDAILAEMPITAQKGERVEEYLPYDIPGPDSIVRVRLIQRGKSDDLWRLDTLSLFDEGIIWEFSVNGGADWYPARGVRNNDNGVLTFPEVGNQLRYRVRALRPDSWVSAIKIRPWYVGKKNARWTGTHRGANVSVYDHDIPIHQDPMFTSWKKPIPYWWFEASRRFPLLPVEGAPNVTEFSRFYGRPVSDTIPTVTDSVTSRVIAGRAAEDWIPMTGDWATRPIPTDWRIVRPIVGLVGPGTPKYFST